jgi:enoyl-CoA hydratase/carnithine racemase
VVLRETREGGVAIWSLARPKVRNALDAATFAALERAVRSAELDATLRAVVLEGEGSNFCAGADVRDAASVDSEAAALAYSDRGAALLASLEALPVPVIGALHGAAFGGGAELALACDFRVGDETTRISFKHAAMGVVTSWGTTARLARLVGRGVAARLLLTAAEVDAEEAARLGLLEVVAAAARTAARELARDLSGTSRVAVAELKRLIAAADRENVRAREREAFARTWMGPDHAEAVRAFLERRRPRF